MSDYGTFCRPELERLLAALRLDVTYVRAAGDRLTTSDGVEILDVVGGYGVTLFGHNHPELVAHARDLLAANTPFAVQGSIRAGAGALARALCTRLGDYVVTFVNSGTEAVEAALKHVFLERTQRLVWSVKGGFHGKTLGSIQLSAQHREPFGVSTFEVLDLDLQAPATWRAAEARAAETAAVFIEPLLGEGGVRGLPDDFVAWLRDVCGRHGIPLVADEVQTGLGRCGTLLASTALGLDPDYVCLGKALGGGLAKIAAACVRRSRYQAAFGMLHTSTFSEDDLSCRIGLKALEILERDELPARAARAGDRLLAGLTALQGRFPGIVREIRGRGLLIGVELHEHKEGSASLRVVSEQGHLGALLAAYFFHVHGIRILPTLGSPLTLRIEPSAYVTDADLDRLLAAFETACRALDAADLRHLSGFLLGLERTPVTPARRSAPPVRRAVRDAPRVAFIGHLLDEASAVDWDAALSSLPEDQIAPYLGRASELLGPTLSEEVAIESARGDVVNLMFLGLTLTSRHFVEAMRAKQTRWLMAKIDKAVQMAKHAGCTMVGFGAYTSIVSRNCLRVTPVDGVAFTTGNSLTVGMGIEGIRFAARERGLDLRHEVLGVVGAGGNIASAYAALLARQVRSVVLVGRRGGQARLEAIAAGIRQGAPQCDVRTATDLSALRDCRAIVTASNAPEAIVFPEHLPDGPTVICDLSVPADVSPRVRAERPDVLVLEGGIVELPRTPDFQIAGITLGRGLSFACMAETLLLGLEGVRAHFSYGPITPELVSRAMAMAERHGFRLGNLKVSPSSKAA